MFVLFAVAIFFVAIPHVAAHDSAKCCMPDKFMISEGYTLGYNSHGHNGGTSGNMIVSVDATKKLVGIIGTFYSNGTKSDLHIIQDYGKTNKQYVIDLETKTCTAGPNTQKWAGTCVPPDATLLSSTYYGKKSSNFLVDLYMVPAPGSQPGVTAYLSVAKDGCVPVGEMVTGSVRGFNFMMSIGFSEYVEGIDDPSVFVIPDICRKEYKIKSKAAKMHRSVGSFVVPSF